MLRKCYWCRVKLPICNMERVAAKNGEAKWSCGKCPKRSKRILEVVAKIKVDDILGGQWRVLARIPVDREIVRRAG